MARIYNFSSGPAALPLPVLEKAREQLVDFENSGMSIMEMSHRGGIFDSVIKTAEKNLRTLLNVPDEYAVLFLPGGASQQFAMIPLNFLPAGGFADYVDSGSWGGKAIKEARILGDVRVVWDGKADDYMRMPAPAEIPFDARAAYAHICSNETIGGVQFHEFPEAPSPLIADMSSDILSRRFDVKRFAMVYAGAQKNLGPSGLAVVILRRDFAERCPDTVNVFFRYRTHIPEPSLYNTPNTWAVYILKLVTDWLLESGGLAAMEERNVRKAALLYGVLDESGFWRPCARKDSRSAMNVTWRLGTPDLESRFVREASAAGLDGLRGHRSVGGIRASIYNAIPEEGVSALVDFMRGFERRNG